MCAMDTMCSSASDLYLSLAIFSNTALVFVFAESIGWHLISLLPHLSLPMSQLSPSLAIVSSIQTFIKYI